VGFGGVGLLELDIVVDEVVLCCWVRKNKKEREETETKAKDRVRVKCLCFDFTCYHMLSS
jgi:hypothetical protein